MSTEATSQTSEAQEAFQITPEQAEVYEERFVPGIFAEWAPRIVAYAEVTPGDRVLDVACGTGIVARAAAAAVAPGGAVTGVDLNPAMLAVAERVGPGITWRRGDAAALPVADDAFDVCTCQMALMFFPDRPAAWREMTRAARRRVAVLVPASIGEQPAYSLLTEVVAEHAGDEGAALLMAYWSAGQLTELTGDARAAGLGDVESRTVLGTAAFGSIDALVATEVEGSPLINRIDEATYARIREAANRALAPFATPDGAVEAPLRCHLVRGVPA